MTESRKGYYCLIQYCPSRSRLEAVNLGVVLYDPQAATAKSMTISHTKRVQRVFGKGVDRRLVNRMKESMAARIDTTSFGSVEELKTFAASRANEILVTQPRSLTFTSFDEELDSLFRDLVGDPERQPAADLPSEIAAFEERLRGPDLRGRIQLDYSVPLPGLRPIEAPYAYRNGSIHLIQPTTFPKNSGNAYNKGRQLLGDGAVLSACEHRLVVVTQFSAQQHELRKEIRNLLELSGAIRLVLADDLDEFYDEVLRVSHPFARG